jgi:transposase
VNNPPYGGEMQGKHERQRSLFEYVDIESLIPKDHLLRKIDGVIELSFVRKLTKKYYSDEEGRPSIDPEVYFRMQIIGYLYGIRSERQLCEEIQVNLAYRWFVGFSLEDEIPDHSSLTKIRNRLGERTYREIFERIVERCKESGLVRGDQIISDSTYVVAGMRRWVRWLEGMEQRKTEMIRKEEDRKRR